MAAFKNLLLENPEGTLLAGGLIIGLLFGALARATGFCTLGGLSDWLNFGDTRRLRSWQLAAGLAIVGATGLEAAGLTDLTRSIYQSPRLDWAGALVGGALFGLGMAFAGGCTSSNLVRAGGGDLRALLTLIAIGLFAEMAMGGVLAPARVAFSEATVAAMPAPTQALGDLAATAFTIPVADARLILGLVIGLAMIVLALASAPFRSSIRHLAAGLGLGLAVVAAWALTGLAYDEMALTPQRPQALSFVKPTSDLIEWLGRSTALGWPGFAVATVIGALLGSFLLAVATRSFRLSTFADTGDTVRHMIGAALMGTGGVMGLGCSIGQGISGVSTLALGSILATLGIIAGAIAGLKALERWVA